MNIKEKQGKIYQAETSEPICECGKEVKLLKYVSEIEFYKTTHTIFYTMFGVCECGNVIFGFKPYKKGETKDCLFVS